MRSLLLAFAVMLTLVVGAAALAPGATTAQAQQAGPQTFEVQCGCISTSFTLTGAGLGDPVFGDDSFDNEWTFDGRLAGTELKVEGRATAGPCPYESAPHVYVTLAVDGNEKVFERGLIMGDSPEDLQDVPFSLAVPIPEGAGTGSFTVSIMEATLYQEDMACRSVEWRGTLSGSPARLQVSAPDPAKPLSYVLRLEQASQAGPYVPVADAPLQVHVYDLDDPQMAIAPYFKASNCQNCESETVGSATMHALVEPSDTIDVTTDGNGEVQLEFFLDFAWLTKAGKVPTRESPLALTVAADYYLEGASPDQRKVLASGQADAVLDAVAAVEAITYVGPQLFHPMTERPLPRSPEAALSTYSDDPGGQDGPATRFGSDRVLLYYPGQETISQSGATPGLALSPGQLLRQGDAVTIIACGMVSGMVRDGLPVGEPGTIWVQVRFFDGMRGRFGVNGSVCKGTMVVGGTGAASGFQSAGAKFVYWALDQGVDSAIEWAVPAYKVVAKIAEAAGWLKWVLGGNPVYVVIESSVYVDSDPQGSMTITTREGMPRVLTDATAGEGVPVPPGKTASLADALEPVVADTPAELAAAADALLASLSGQPLQAEGEMGATDLGAPGGGGSPRIGAPVIAGFGCVGVLLVAVVLVGVLAIRQQGPAAGPSPRTLGCAIAVAAVCVAAAAGVAWYALRSSDSSPSVPAATQVPPAPTAAIVATAAASEGETVAAPQATVGSGGSLGH